MAEDKDTVTNIKDLVQRALPDDSLFVVDIIVRGSTRKLVRIMVDGDQGISVQQCAQISKKLRLDIEMDDLIAVPYTLEVSSPGVSLSLKLARQYAKHIGRQIKITISNEQVFVGELLQVDGKGMVVGVKIAADKKAVIEKQTFSFDDIKTAYIMVAFK